MSVRLSRRRRGIQESVREAINAVGWRKLLLWSAVAAVAVAFVANTFWLMIETLFPPGAVRQLELMPYFAGMFIATVVGQVLGPRLWVRRQMERLDPAYRVWFSANNPIAKLNHILWDEGTEAQINRFRNAVYSQAYGYSNQTYDHANQTSAYADQNIDRGRTALLTSVSMSLESVMRQFPIADLDRSRLAEFGAKPTEECLASLARQLREAGWGRIELRPSMEWLAYSLSSVVGAVFLLVVMVILLAQMPTSGPGADGAGFLLLALATQWPFYTVCIAFFMLLSAGRAAGIVEAAAPKGKHVGNIDDALGLARDPFERIRVFMAALPADERKALLESMHYSLWKVVRTHKPDLTVPTADLQRQASGN